MSSSDKSDLTDKKPSVPGGKEAPVDDVVDIGEVIGILGNRGAKKFDAEALAAILKKKVIGQDKVADQITGQLKRRLAQAELSKKSNAKVEKPLGVFILAGPPGVGKTYFGKVLAENMYEGKGRLVHVDMAQFMQAHATSSLVGSPQGYVGGEGSLTSALNRDPKSIILLDEFEKAHPDVQKIFLTAWNDGFITDVRTQKHISTTQAIFMLTTNAAMDRLVEIEQTFKDDPNGRKKAVIEALKAEKYAPEVLSRIDSIFVFEALDDTGMARLAAVEIQMLAKKYNLTVTKIDTDYLVALITNGEAFASGGARELSRILDTQLGDQMLDAQVDGAEFIRISLVDGAPFVRKVEEKKS
jgi:ATP-dependent Clp protease ATP-binding subunit ClpA